MNNNDELNMLREKRRRILKKIFLIGAIVFGIFFLGDLMFNGVNYEFLIYFIFCIMALYYLKKDSNNNKKNLSNNNYSNNNNYNINNEKDYIDFLYEKISILYEKFLNDRTISVVPIAIIFTIILFIVVFVFIVFASNNVVNIPMYDTDIALLCLIVFVCLLPLFFSFYYKNKIKERGRTKLNINAQGNYWEIDAKIKNILSYLYYKEIKYKNSKVFYSFKTRTSLLNTSSVPRYLTYEIKDGYVEFECWFFAFKEELPISIEDNNYGIIQRKALINDIKFIKDNFKTK